MASLQYRAEAEIVARHAFFVDWFTGTADDRAIEDCARCFAPDFRMVWPNGSELERGPLLDLLRGMRGTKRAGEYAIEVTMHHAALYAPDLVLVVFDEHQRTVDGENRRRASALFGPDDAAPGGVVWRYMHQTWIAAPDA